MSPLTRIALILPAILLTLLLFAIGACLWLVSSDAGTRWLGARAQAQLAGSIEWQELEGSLLGPLTLRGLQVSQPGLQVAVRDLRLDWEPATLLQGRVTVNGLAVEGVRVALSPAEPDSQAEPFDPAALQLPVDITLAGVRIDDLQLTQGDGAPQVVNHIGLEASLDSNKLTLHMLEVRVAQGGLALTGSSALDNPMPLQLQANWDWQMTQAGADPSALVAEPAAIPLTGALALEGALDWSQGIDVDLAYRTSTTGLASLSVDLPDTVDVTGNLRGRYAGDILNLETLEARLNEARVAVQGEVALPTDGEPGFDLSLQWSTLQWPLAATVPTIASPSGKLALAGTADAYTVIAALKVSGEQLPESDWQARAEGNLSELNLTPLRGRLLGGELRIGGTLAWDPLPRWSLQLRGDALDPGQFLPDYPGELAISLRSSGQLQSDEGVRAGFELEKLSGSLLDYPVELSAGGSLAGETVQLEHLLLDSDGNQLRARGRIAPTAIALEWQLQVPSPGALLPGASGELTGSGQVKGSPESPRLQGKLSGRNLAMESLELDRLDAAVEAGLQADDNLEIELTTGMIENGGEPLLTSLRLDANGTTGAHTLNLAVEAGGAEVQTRLRGGLNLEAPAWRGELIRLNALQERYGEWQLDAPAGLTLTADRASLANSCLQHAATAGRLCLLVDWAATGSSTLAAELWSLPAGLLLPEVSGDIAGRVNLGLSPKGALRGDAALAMAPGAVTVELDESVTTLSHGGGKFDASIGDAGLVGELTFDAPENGKIAAQLTLPALNTWPLSEPQPIAGTLQASLPDLSSFAAWIPEIERLAGQLQADLAFAGSLAQPQVTGELRLDEGAASIPMAGLSLRQVELAAVSDPGRPGILKLTGGVTSGGGRAEVSGEVHVLDRTLDLALRGEGLEVYNTPDVRALLSPDLQIGWRDDTLKLRGRLVIPRADITPKLALNPAASSDTRDVQESAGQMIAPSPDVVVVNGAEDREASAVQLEAPFRIDSQIQLILEDAVKVDAMGFVSRLSGDVTFTNTPEQRELIPLARGRLSIIDGTFRAFGQDLDIQTGQLIFGNVPATEPELNVRAVRWIDNDPQVTAAGVLVSGPAREPLLELFSRPQLESSEIQSYLLTGRSAGDEENVLSIGTYLTPKFYVGYGYNLLENTSEFNSLFSITPRYGVGANFGEADNNIYINFTHER